MSRFLPHIALVSLLLGLQTACFAQNKPRRANHLGFGVQVYPAGVIPTVDLEHDVTPNTSLLFRLGGNFTDRQDFSSKNDQEKGSGFGGSLGFRRHIPARKGGWVLGLHTDLWNLWIDWKNTPDIEFPTFAPLTPPEGTTYVLVVQPWLEAGYVLPLPHTRSRLGLSVGFGREFNLITNGRAVEQDWIASARIYYQLSL